LKIAPKTSCPVVCFVWPFAALLRFKKGIFIFVPNQNCSTFQIASGTTELVNKFKIDFFEGLLSGQPWWESFWAWWIWCPITTCSPSLPSHFPFLHCVLYLILKFSFSDVPDSTWSTSAIVKVSSGQSHKQTPHIGSTDFLSLQSRQELFSQSPHIVLLQGHMQANLIGGSPVLRALGFCFFRFL
jgi:hypothetical protein